MARGVLRVPGLLLPERELPGCCRELGGAPELGRALTWPLREPFSLRADGGRRRAAEELEEGPRGVGVLGRPLAPGRGVGVLRVGLRPGGPLPPPEPPPPCAGLESA